MVKIPSLTPLMIFTTEDSVAPSVNSGFLSSCETFSVSFSSVISDLIVSSLCTGLPVLDSFEDNGELIFSSCLSSCSNSSDFDFSIGVVVGVGGTFTSSGL